jgi:hypothetical protein
MPELSPHAQAIKDAVLALYSDEKVQKFGWRLDVRTVAATLRAAADQLAYGHTGRLIIDEKALLAIADELEAQ